MGRFVARARGLRRIPDPHAHDSKRHWYRARTLRVLAISVSVHRLRQLGLSNAKKMLRWRRSKAAIEDRKWPFSGACSVANLSWPESRKNSLKSKNL